GEAELRAGDGDLDAGKAGEEPLERDGRLHASERGPQAHVDAGAEGDVAIGVAADVDLLGILEGGGIAVGGGEAGEDHLAAADGLAVELGVFAGVARLADLGKRDVAEELLGG